MRSLRLLLLITCGCSTVSVEMMTLPAAEIRVASEPTDPTPAPITKIEIEDQVQFTTWKAEILKESFDVLDKVASTIKEHPELELVEVQGHTAKANQPDKTRRLSQERAEAVRKYLVRKGIDPERLVAKGYGEDKPIADNETEDGRSQNRRVDFVVLKNNAGEVATAEGAEDEE